MIEHYDLLGKHRTIWDKVNADISQVFLKECTYIKENLISCTIDDLESSSDDSDEE